MSYDEVNIPMALRFKRLLAATLVLGTLAYAGICGLVYSQQGSLMFFPSPDLTTTPRDAGLPYQEWRLPSSDGAEVVAWYIPHPEARAQLLFCHGNGGNISHRVSIAQELHKLGLSVVLFDYRSYGQSRGQLHSERQLLDDAQVVYDRMLKESSLPVLLYGESLGGGVATATAEKNPYKALILQSTFTSLSERASQQLPWLPVRWLSRFHLDSRRRLKTLHGPVLVMHSPTDEVIGYAHGQALFAAAPEPKFWCELSGGHNELDVVAWRTGMQSLLKELSL